jgi:protein-tyrosine phosphatase
VLVEIHAHILPGLDDGPQSLAESLSLAQAFLENGASHVVATPHFWPGTFDNSLILCDLALESLRDELDRAGLGALKLSLGGEVRLTEAILEMHALNTLPYLGEFEGKKTLLLEMPDGHIPLGTQQLLAWLINKNIVPIIAHPERNRAVRDTPQLAADLVQWGALLQITAGAVLGEFGPKVQAASHWLLDQNLVAAVASDAHNVGARPPRLAESRDWIAARFGHDRARELTQTMPAQLAGLPLQ